MKTITPDQLDDMPVSEVRERAGNCREREQHHARLAAHYARESNKALQALQRRAAAKKPNQQR